MNSNILTEDAGQETEKTLAGMNSGQFSMLLDDLSVVASLIPQGDHVLTLEALLKRVYHEAGKRGIAGYETYIDQAEPHDSDDPKGRAEKTLLDHGLVLNKRGEVVPIFPQS